MNAETAAAIAEAFREHRDAFGVAITINGDTISAVVNDSPYSRELIEGGFANDGEISVKCLTADLSTTPAIGQTCSYKSRSFLISSVSIQPGSAVAEIQMRPARGK